MFQKGTSPLRKHHLRHKEGPNRQSLSSLYLPKYRESLVVRMKERMGISCFWLLDSWTGKSSYQYVAVTVHGIDQDWRFCNFLLDLVNVRKSETSVYQAALLKKKTADQMGP
jgi:hypothetical protein